MRKVPLSLLAVSLLTAVPLAAHFPAHRPGPWRQHHRMLHRHLPWPWHNTARMTLACYSGQLSVIFRNGFFLPLPVRHRVLAPRQTVMLAVNFGQNDFEYETIYRPVRLRRPVPPPRPRPPVPPRRIRPHRRPVPPPAVRPAPRPARHFAPRPPAGRAQFGLTPSPRPSKRR